MSSSRVPVSSSSSPSRRHRYAKALPAIYSHEIPEQEARELREIVSDLETAANGPKLDFSLGLRALNRLVSVKPLTRLGVHFSLVVFLIISHAW